MHLTPSLSLAPTCHPPPVSAGFPQSQARECKNQWELSRETGDLRAVSRTCTYVRICHLRVCSVSACMCIAVDAGATK